MKSEESNKGNKSRRGVKRLIIVLAVLLVVVLAVPAIVMYIGKSFTAQETVVRSDCG